MENHQNTAENRLLAITFLFAILIIALVAIILATNFLVFCSILLYPAFSSAYHVFLFSLSIADFCMGALTIPIHFRNYIFEPRKNETLCVILLALKKIGIDGSLWHLLAISFDRYMAVICPLKYRKLVTRDRAKAVVLVIWLYILVLMAIPVLGYRNSMSFNRSGCYYFAILPYNYIIWSSFITKIICLAIPAVLYSHISVVIYKQVRRFNKDISWSKDDIRQFQRQLTTLKVSSALTFFFIIAWLPWLIVCMLQYHGTFPEKNVRIVNLTVETLTFVNAAVNAPIYAICGKKAREVYCVMISLLPWQWKEELQKLYEEDTSVNPISTNYPSEWQLSESHI